MPAPKRCTKCVYHGDLTPHAADKCPREACTCKKCVLYEERRVLINKLNTDKVPASKAADDKADSSRYTCSKCRRHGIVVPKKFHEPCPFTLCTCETCELTVRKGMIDRELAAMVRSDKDAESSPPPSYIFINPVLLNQAAYQAPAIQSQVAPLSPEVKVILDLLTLLTQEENNENFDEIDFDALKAMLASPTIVLPNQWMPHLATITELVYIAMKKLPCFRDFDFERGLV